MCFECTIYVFEMDQTIPYSANNDAYCPSTGKGEIGGTTCPGFGCVMHKKSNSEDGSCTHGSSDVESDTIN